MTSLRTSLSYLGPIVVGIAGTTSAYAACSWNRAHTLFTCDNVWSENAAAFAIPNLSNAIQVVPGALPTFETPTGIELTYNDHTDRNSQGNFHTSVIKGFKGVGIGAGTWDLSSLYSPNLSQAFEGTQWQQAYNNYQGVSTGSQGFRTGSAAAIPLGAWKKYFRLNFGASFGESPFASILSSSYSLVADTGWGSLSYVVDQEKISDSLPAVSLQSLIGTYQLSHFVFGVSRVQSQTDVSQPLTVVYSIRWSGDYWTAYGAIKTPVTETFVLRRKLKDHFALEYIYGQYRNSNSVNLQIFI